MVRIAIRWMFAAGVLLTLDARAQGIDVRLVVDVSGSMKSGDPENLRQDVLNSLVELLAPGSRAGVWTFGRSANMVVPHGVIDAAWRRTARGARAGIVSAALRTNLGDALAAATWDAGQAAVEWERHVVLVSDGRVDLADDAAINDAQRRVIMNELLPRLRLARIRVDCLALSTDADMELLRQIANATGGSVGHADTVDAVKEYLVGAIGSDRGSAGITFSVPANTPEFTVLARHSGPAPALLTPANERIDAVTAAAGIRWHDVDGSTLVTVTAPAAGTWQFVPAPDRLRVWSTLALDVRPDDTAEAPALRITLTDGEQPITEPGLAAMVALDASLTTLYGRETLNVTAVNGEALVYRVDLGPTPLTADDTVTAHLAGKTFELTRAYTQRIAHPIDVEFRDAADGNAAAMVRVNAADLNPATLRVLASTRIASGRAKLVVGEKQPDGAWLVAIPGMDEKVDITFKVIFNQLNNKELEVESEPIAMNLPLSAPLRVGLDLAGHVIIDPVRPPPVVVPQPEPTAVILEPAADAITVLPAASVVVTPAVRTLAMTEWLAMAAITIVMVLLFVWLVVRSSRASPSRLLDESLAGYRAVLVAASAHPVAAANT
jgi:hypothetical protein